MEKVTHRRGGVRVIRVRVVVILGGWVRAGGTGTNGTQPVLSRYIWRVYTGIARADDFTKP